MPLGIAYWRTKWDEAQPEVADEAAGKTLSLLAAYMGHSKFLMALDWHRSYPGQLFKFFSKGWHSDRYTTQVTDAISNFFHASGEQRHGEEFHSVRYIVALVKLEIRGIDLNANDNLSNILDVIREKTMVDYMSLDANTIVTHYETVDRGAAEGWAKSNLSSAPNPSALNPRNTLTESLQLYLDSFNNNESFSETFQRLEIETAEHPDLICPISLDIVNKPVRLNGRLFDFANLIAIIPGENQTRKNPLSRHAFYLDDMQPASDIKLHIEALIGQKEQEPSYKIT